MEPPALVDLPVDAGGGVIMALDAVHSKVMAKSARMLGVNQRQGDEGAPVRVPGGKHGQAAQAGGLLAAV